MSSVFWAWFSIMYAFLCMSQAISFSVRGERGDKDVVPGQTLVWSILGGTFIIMAVLHLHDWWVG